MLRETARPTIAQQLQGLKQSLPAGGAGYSDHARHSHTSRTGEPLRPMPPHRGTDDHIPMPLSPKRMAHETFPTSTKSSDFRSPNQVSPMNAHARGGARRSHDTSSDNSFEHHGQAPLLPHLPPAGYGSPLPFAAERMPERSRGTFQPAAPTSEPVPYDSPTYRRRSRGESSPIVAHPSGPHTAAATNESPRVVPQLNSTPAPAPAAAPVLAPAPAPVALPSVVPLAPFSLDTIPRSPGRKPQRPNIHATSSPAQSPLPPAPAAKHVQPDEHAAATDIQRVYRSHSVRKQVNETKAQAPRVTKQAIVPRQMEFVDPRVAATDVRKPAGGSPSKQQTRTPEPDPHQAATDIQRVYRSHSVRKQLSQPGVDIAVADDAWLLDQKSDDTGRESDSSSTDMLAKQVAMSDLREMENLSLDDKDLLEGLTDDDLLMLSLHFDEAARHNSAIQIQRTFRAHNARRQLKELKAQLSTTTNPNVKIDGSKMALVNRKEAAVAIQGVVRGRASRKRVAIMKKYANASDAEREAAAIAIQKVIRGRLARQQVQRQYAGGPRITASRVASNAAADAKQRHRHHKHRSKGPRKQLTRAQESTEEWPGGASTISGPSVSQIPIDEGLSPAKRTYGTKGFGVASMRLANVVKQVAAKHGKKLPATSVRARMPQSQRLLLVRYLAGKPMAATSRLAAEQVLRNLQQEQRKRDAISAIATSAAAAAAAVAASRAAAIAGGAAGSAAPAPPATVQQAVARSRWGRLAEVVNAGGAASVIEGDKMPAPPPARPGAAAAPAPGAPQRAVVAPARAAPAPAPSKPSPPMKPAPPAVGRNSPNTRAPAPRGRAPVAAASRR